MSCIYKGVVIDSELSANSKGGSEMMRQRLIDNMDAEVLERLLSIYRDQENYMMMYQISFGVMIYRKIQKIKF